MNSSRVTKNLRKAVENKAKNTIEKALETGKAAAEEGYKKAKYDGSIDDIVVSFYPTEQGYTLVSNGQGVRAIEFGATGHLGDRVIYPRVTTGPGKGRPFWFYRLKPGNKFKAGGGVKMSRRKHYRSFKDKTTGKENIYTPRMIRNSAKLYNEETDEPLSVREYLYNQARTAKKGQEWPLQPQPKYGYTFGNEPQNVMLNARKEIVKDLRKHK